MFTKSDSHLSREELWIYLMTNSVDVLISFGTKKAYVGGSGGNIC